VLIVAALTVTSSIGCGGKSLKPGDTDYGSVSGTFTSVEQAPYQKVVKATTTAMQGLAMKPMERDRDGFRTFLVGESVFGQVSQSHEVRVWITRLTEDTTRLEMRILGRREEQRLRVLHGEIRKLLGSPAAATQPAQPAQPAEPAKPAGPAQ
jgi:hypothetical protein